MTDKPILFSALMVRALLDGRKTQTRRVLKPQPKEYSGYRGVQAMLHAKPDEIKIPYAIGDRLWVREAFRFDRSLDDTPPRELTKKYAKFEADRRGTHGFEPLLWMAGKYRPAMHMPRELCRIELDVTDVRVQRVQDISDGDAKAEGVEFLAEHDRGASDAFSRLWDSLNDKRGFGWDANPWVAAYTFERERDDD